MGQSLLKIENNIDPVYSSIPVEQCSFSPLDVILFKGGDFVSNTIRDIERSEVKNGAFSHSALLIPGWAIDPQVLALDPNQWYTWEITMSGKLNDGVTDVQGRSFLGVQIRSFSAIVDKVRANPKVKMAWLPFKTPITTLYPRDEIIRRITALYLQTKESPYEFTPCILLASAIPIFRKCTTKTASDRRFFCSEFVAYILKEMGILAKETQEQYVLPVDFIPGVDADHQVNCCQAPTYLV